MVIAHNLTAMNAQRQYGIVTSSKAKNTEKLSSGYKINRAADDAAGLTISEKMRSQIRGLNQGSANIQDGVSLVQIADGALAEVNDMLHRMTELSIKSANGTNTSEDRGAIQKEMRQIIQEIDRIHESTEFNTMKLFDGETALLDDGSKLGGLVKCKAADTGHLTEAVQDKNGRWHPAAILDFSNIRKSNIQHLYDKEFSFTCSQSCNETFTFKLANGGGDKADNLTGRTEHKYTIDISKMSSGSQIINKIMEYVNANPPDSDNTGNPNIKEASFDNALKVSHSNGMAKLNNNTLVIYSTFSYPSKSEAEKEWKDSTSKYGAVDTGEITGTYSEIGKMKPFWIQASGSSPDDGMMIEIEKMDAEYIGIDKVDVSTQDGAKDAIDVIKDATSMISAMRSALGAYQNRLEHAYANNMNKAENTTAAESRIRDTDMADQMVKFTKDSILMQATESMMAQANQSTQGVLSLLQ